MNDISLADMKVIDAIIEHKTAQRASIALGISSSSISYMLKRLRKATQQVLFVRTRWGLLPDEYALALQKQYREMQSLSAGRREFIVTTYSPVELLIGLRLQTLPQEHLSLRFQGMPETAEERLKNLRQRSVDIDIGICLPNDNAVVSYPYLSSGMCVMVSQHHTSVRESFTRRDWYENRHIIWQRGNHDINDIVTSQSAGHTIFNKRNIACESTSLLAMAHLCAYSDNIMLVPKIFAPAIKEIYPVKAFDLPWDISLQFDCHIHYHKSINLSPNAAVLIKLFDDLL